MTNLILSEHFNLTEFERSSTAQANNIDNSCPSQFIPALNQLCKTILEPLRQHFGEPVIITSGYRCNQRQTPYTLKAWFDWLKDSTNFDQLILEHDSKGSYWIHVSCRKNRKKNRHQVFYDLKK